MAHSNFNQEYEPHELCKIFPVMQAEQFSALIESIRDNGLLSPIMLHEGKILDGRHRYKACINLSIEPSFEEYEGDDALGYVIALNLSRRHLNESQRAMIAARLANMKLGDNQHKVGGQICPPSTMVSNDDAAKKLSIGARSVKSAKKVLKEGTL